MINFIKAVANLPNTFWGILILFASMYIAVKYNNEIGYYFAGVGSTLCGISHLTSPNTTTTVGSDPQVKVETNASDPTSQS